METTRFSSEDLVKELLGKFGCTWKNVINPVRPNDTYRGRSAPLISEVAFYIFIQQI